MLAGSGAVELPRIPPLEIAPEAVLPESIGGVWEDEETEKPGGSMPLDFQSAVKMPLLLATVNGRELRGAALLEIDVATALEPTTKLKLAVRPFMFTGKMLGVEAVVTMGLLPVSHIPEGAAFVPG